MRVIAAAMRVLVSQMLFLCVRGYVALGTAPPGTVGRAFRGPLALQRLPLILMTVPDPTDQSPPALQQPLAPEQWTVRATAGRATQQRHSKVESNSKVTLTGGSSKKKLFVTKVRRGNSSPAAERVHELGALAGSAMPPASKVDDPQLAKEHAFSRDASWLIPGYVLCGSYPGASPGRASDNGLLSQVRAAGVSTFVCLQDELPPQDAPWPADGVPNLSDRAKWAAGNFLSYREAAGPDASFVHIPLPDRSVAESLDALDDIVCGLRRRIEAGEKLYLHCWGGRGRTGLIAACLLGALYGDLDAAQALERVQCYYDLRQPLGRGGGSWKDYPTRKLSPETDEQNNQVRDWYSFKRIIARADIAPTSIPETFSIKARGSAETIEVVSPSASHPLTRADALRRVSDADVLGKGQFGKVYRGSSKKHGDVAIKVVPDGAPSHDRSRLALEAKILRAMSGKRGSVVLHYDARQTVFGRPSDVLVMSLLGGNVETVLSKGDAERHALVLKIGRDVVQCLRSLHEAGYIHNDVKPANILFGPPGTDRKDDAHLMDFGMATCTGILQDSVVEGRELAAGGGTPLYASLAQLEGRTTSPVDDIESLWYDTCTPSTWLHAPRCYPVACVPPAHHTPLTPLSPAIDNTPQVLPCVSRARRAAVAVGAQGARDQHQEEALHRGVRHRRRRVRFGAAQRRGVLDGALRGVL
jgi:hypothetical protein